MWVDVRFGIRIQIAFLTTSLSQSRTNSTRSRAVDLRERLAGLPRCSPTTQL